MVTTEVEALAAILRRHLSFDDEHMLIAALEVAQRSWTDEDTKRYGTQVANRITEED